MKGLEKLKVEIKKANDELMVAEKLRDSAIQEELILLKNMIDYLEDALITEYINGHKAYLIYIYESSEKRTISNKVYYCADGKIRYQVYKKEEYLGYNPTVEYEGSYAVVDAAEMFKNLDVQDVLEFFVERVVDVPKKAQKIKNSALEKKNFVNNPF